MFVKTRVIDNVAYVIMGDDKEHVDVYEGENLMFSNITLKEAIRRVDRIELEHMMR